MIDSYRDFARLPSAKRATGRRSNCWPPRHRAGVVHCTAGKDRTGWLVAVILRILGVSWSDIERDYLTSGPAVHELFADYLATLPPVQRHARPSRPSSESSRSTSDAAREWAESHYPVFDAYVAQGLGVRDEPLDALSGTDWFGQSSSDSTLM